MFPLKYNTANQVIPLGPTLDSTDGDTEVTSGTISNTDIWIWKNGATSIVNKNSGGATHMQNGLWYTTLDATDTNTYGPIKIYVHESGSLYLLQECVVMNVSAYNKLFSSTGFVDFDPTDTLAEDYAADGSAVNLIQGIYELLSLLGEYEKSGATMSYKKRDGSTEAFQSTLDSASLPTSHTRSS